MALATEQEREEERLIRLLARLDVRLRNEYDLVTARVGWLLAAQGFLYAALATLLAVDKPRMAHGAPTIVTTVVAIVVLIGAVSSFSFGRALLAGHNEIKRLKDLRRPLLERYGFEGTDPHKDHERMGDGLPLLLPRFLFLTWIAVLFACAMFAGGFQEWPDTPAAKAGSSSSKFERQP